MSDVRLQPRPVVLEDDHVRLEPLEHRHAADLHAAGGDGDIWRYFPRSAFATVADVTGWIDAAHEARDAGGELPFAVIHRREGVAVGSTRYMDIRPEHRALEIGHTWLGTAWQRTVVNTACKFLLLQHAFETLGAARVQLKTDVRNEQSQRAMERIGAVREGVLRQSMILPGGHVRDSVYYSIVAAEWPQVADRLRERLASGARSSGGRAG